MRKLGLPLPIQAVVASAWAGIQVGAGLGVIGIWGFEQSWGALANIGIGLFVGTLGVVDLVKAIRQWWALCGMISVASKGCNTAGCPYERFGPLDRSIGFCPGCGVKKAVQRKEAKNVVN